MPLVSSASTLANVLEAGHQVVGIDNLNDYYDVSLKQARLELLAQPGFQFHKIDLADREGMTELFASGHFERVIHLAAQAGVRYSLENPHAYADSNLTGFLNILEGCRHNKIQHLTLCLIQFSLRPESQNAFLNG